MAGDTPRRAQAGQLAAGQVFLESRLRVQPRQGDAGVVPLHALTWSQTRTLGRELGKGSWELAHCSS